MAGEAGAAATILPYWEIAAAMVPAAVAVTAAEAVAAREAPELMEPAMGM
jgi:hypothetical protein